MTDAEILERIKEWSEQWQSISPADIQWLLARIEALAEQLIAAQERERGLREAALDALSGWRYAREVYGDLPGVGWHRVQILLERALAHAPEVGAEEGT